jgi:hypothetical protein
VSQHVATDAVGSSAGFKDAQLKFSLSLRSEQSHRICKAILNDGIASPARHDFSPQNKLSHHRNALAQRIDANSVSDHSRVEN